MACGACGGGYCCQVCGEVLYVDKTNDLLEELQDVKTERDRLQRSRLEAAKIGYIMGHNDTVESRYSDPEEVARDICQEMDGPLFLLRRGFADEEIELLKRIT